MTATATKKNHITKNDIELVERLITSCDGRRSRFYQQYLWVSKGMKPSSSIFLNSLGSGLCKLLGLVPRNVCECRGQFTDVPSCNPPGEGSSIRRLTWR